MSRIALAQMDVGIMMVKASPPICGVRLRFITPSFPSNSIGMLDLNSIAIGVSLAYNMKIEHPNGSEYSKISAGSR